MNRSPILVIALLWGQGHVIPQATIQWERTLGGSGSDIAYAISPAVVDGSFVTGKTASNDGNVTGHHGGEDVWVVRLSAFGTIHWQKALGGSSNEYALGIATSLDGGCVVAGRTQSNDGDVSNNHGSLDAWVVKLDGSGALQWQRSLGGTLSDYAHCIRATNDGGYIIAGQTRSNDGDVSGNHGADDAWIVKLDPSGMIEWQHALGGSDIDKAYDIIQTAEGGYLAVGETDSNNGDVTDNHGLLDAWVVKLNGAGAIQWQKTLGGSEADVARSVAQTADGGYLVAGESLSSDGDVIGNHGGNDIWLVKLQPSGANQWQRCLGGSSSDRAQGVMEFWDGGSLVVGESSSNNGDVAGNHGGGDVWVTHCQPSGASSWQLALGGSMGDRAYGVTASSAGGYLVVGSTFSNDGDVSGNHGGGDAWVVKLYAGGIGMDEYGLAHFEIAPNPATGSFQIQLTRTTTSAQLRILDAIGQEVVQRNLISTRTLVDLSDLATGIYVVNVRSEHGSSSQRLFLE